MEDKAKKKISKHETGTGKNGIRPLEYDEEKYLQNGRGTWDNEATYSRWSGRPLMTVYPNEGGFLEWDRSMSPYRHIEGADANDNDIDVRIIPNLMKDYLTPAPISQDIKGMPSLRTRITKKVIPFHKSGNKFGLIRKGGDGIPGIIYQGSRVRGFPSQGDNIWEMIYYPDQNNLEKYISKYVDYGMEDPTEYYYTVGYGDLDDSEDQEAIRKLFPTDITNIPYNIYDYYGARSKRYFSGEQVKDRFGQDDIPDDYEGNNSEGSYNWGEKARTKKHKKK